MSANIPSPPPPSPNLMFAKSPPPPSHPNLISVIIIPSSPPQANEAVAFYEGVFGAQTIQHSSHPVAVGVEGNKSLTWLSNYCIFVGSTHIIVSDQ
ncbi:hypothetical protein Pyn_14340 [Prunus yedoensis var. nudiflora]|uniref:Uncharacterized protein n=1 Tax=Prunus yedoensis var. nudiflora TaxID=2094558 RepID=A0A314URZ3_PRUYE|nr:hypothetical protein Pyn_14340 [Prunus yedoensis var. nudiflora]